MIHSSRSPERNRVRDGLLLLLGVGLALLGGCGGDSEKPPPGTEPPPSSSSGTAPPPPEAPSGYAEAEPEGPTAAGGPGSYPDNFPEDVPLHPTAEPENWVAAQGAGLLMSFNADTDPDDLFRYYVTELQSAGWQAEPQDLGERGIWQIQASKGQRTLRISISQKEDGRGSHFAIAESP